MHVSKAASVETSQDSSISNVDIIIKTINNEIGTNLLAIYSDKVSFNASVLCKHFEKFTTDLIKNHFEDNRSLQLLLAKITEQHMSKATPILKALFEEKGISKSEFDKLGTRSLKRAAARNFDLSDIINQLVIAQLESIFAPIQSNINSFLDKVFKVITTSYASTTSSNNMVNIWIKVTNKLLLQLANFVKVFQSYINLVINDIIYGNTTTNDSSTTST